MMKLVEIGAAAAALGNQVAAGIPVDQALGRMVRLQPNYAEFWNKTVQDIQSGKSLSDSLVEVWPQALVSAVRAGEHAGKMEEVFAQIEETVDLQLTLRGAFMKLSYPFGMGVAGLGVFLAFMIVVLPMLAKSLGSNRSGSIIFQASSWMSAFVFENWMTISAAAAVGLIMLISWLKTEEARKLIVETGLMIPVLNGAMRDLFFGLWARYMALMTSAGIPTTTALNLTAQILPGDLCESIYLFERDLSTNNLTLSAAADTANLKEHDLRVTWWPVYISNAFIVAEQTGAIDKELRRVAPSLIKEGVKTLNQVIGTANVVALALSAFLIVSPLAAYYMEIFAAIRAAGH